MVTCGVSYKCDGCGKLHPIPDLGVDDIRVLWTSTDYKATCPKTGVETTLIGQINVIMVPVEEPPSSYIEQLRQDNPDLSEEMIQLIAKVT